MFEKENTTWLLYSRLPSPAVPPHLAKIADRIDSKIKKAIDDAWRRAHGDICKPTRGCISVYIGVDQDGAISYEAFFSDYLGLWGEAHDKLPPLIERLMAKTQFAKDCRTMADAIRKNPESFQ